MGHEMLVGNALTSELPSGPSRSAAPARRRSAPGKSRLWARLTPWLVALGSVAIMLLGWSQRDYRYITAANGLGYALGIIGGSMMLALLLYPARKRLRFMSRFGRVRGWFRMHMLLGIFGPTLILVHGNFHFGSMNSGVALISMLTVAASGIVGRFFYTRTHYGMLSHKQALQALQDEQQVHLRSIAPMVEHSATLKSLFQQLRERLVPDDRGLPAALACVLTLGAQARKTRRLARREMRRIVRTVAKRQSWTRSQARSFRRRANAEMRLYVDTIVKVAEFDFYQRLFALWHVLHLPLFILLIITGVFHVVAVHMY